MSNKDNDNEFDFLPPAEPPPSFNQEKDHYHEEVAAEDFGMVEDFGLQMEYSDEDLLPENTAPSSLNVGFVGVGGGGNKMANAFILFGLLIAVNAYFFVRSRRKARESQGDTDS